MPTRSVAWIRSSASGTPPGASDRITKRNRPAVLDQRNAGGCAVRDRVGHVPNLVVIEDLLVGERLGAGKRTRFGAFFAGRAETDQRPHVGAELHRFVFAQVARVQRLDVALVVLPHDRQVDQADDVLVLQALELLEDLAFELRLVEADYEHLYRANSHRHLTSSGGSSAPSLFAGTTRCRRGRHRCKDAGAAERGPGLPLS